MTIFMDSFTIANQGTTVHNLLNFNNKLFGTEEQLSQHCVILRTQWHN
jgi:hypothetical protein